MGNFSWLLLVLLAFHESQASPRAKRLVNGHDAKPEDFPYEVSIQPAKVKQHHCGGVIVNQYFVLTAAHCVEGFDAEDFKIVSGTIDLTKPAFVNQVSEIFVKDGYSRSVDFQNDIALLKVTIPFPISTAVLPEPKEKINCTEAVASGFGRTDVNSFPSKILKEAVMMIKPVEYCKKEFKKAGETIDDSNICAYDPKGASIWKGDSGSPLVCNNKVYGISIRGLRDLSHYNYPSIFTKVSKYVTWIKSIVH